MATTITYNEIELPQQLRKLNISRTANELEFASIHAVLPADFKNLCDELCQDNKSFTIVAGDYEETFLLGDDADGATPVTGIKSVFEKVGEKVDGAGLMLCRFLVRAKFQAASGNGVVDYNVSWTQNDQGVYVLTITGELTGVGTASALETFDAQISDLSDFAQGLFPDAFFDEPSTFGQIDKDTGNMKFSRSWNELADPSNTYDGNTELRDATIIFPVWSVAKTRTTRRGLDETHLTEYAVKWQARLQKDKVETTVISQYEGEVRALIIKRIKSIFSESDTLILEDDTIEYGRSEQTANGTWRVTSNGNLVSYGEVLAALVVVADSDKVLDGKNFTEAPFSPGVRLELTQVVKHVTRGSPPPVPAAPIVAFNGQQLSTFLREFTPEESHEIVGAETGAHGELTGQATEYTLNWRAVYRAYAIGAPKEDHDTGSAKKMNQNGAVVPPPVAVSTATGPSGSGNGSATTSEPNPFNGVPAGPSGSTAL